MGGLDFLRRLLGGWRGGGGGQAKQKQLPTYCELFCLLAAPVFFTPSSSLPFSFCSLPARHSTPAFYPNIFSTYMTFTGLYPTAVPFFFCLLHTCPHACLWHPCSMRQGTALTACFCPCPALHTAPPTCHHQTPSHLLYTHFFRTDRTDRDRQTWATLTRALAWHAGDFEQKTICSVAPPVFLYFPPPWLYATFFPTCLRVLMPPHLLCLI